MACVERSAFPNINLSAKMSKILAVVGATGQQGSSVIKHVTSHPELSKTFKVRALTRSPEKARGQLPSDTEVVQVDLDDVESLKAAFRGVDTVFGVTDYWQKCDKEYEKQQGINIADAAKAAGVRHLIWSASTDVRKITKGEIQHCEYFDNKAEVMEYIEQIKGDSMMASYPTPAVFMQNFKREITLGPDNVPTWYKPWDLHKTRVPYIDAVDSGMYVAGIMLQGPEEMNGVKILSTAEWLSPKEILDQASREIGKEILFQQVSPEAFQEKLPPAFGAALTANMVWMRDYGFFGPGAEDTQPQSDRVLGTMKPKSWREFVRQNGQWEWTT